MPQETLLAPTQLLAFPVGDWQVGGVLLSDAVPEILDELQPFRAVELEERREFGAHDREDIEKLDERNALDRLLEIGYRRSVIGY